MDLVERGASAHRHPWEVVRADFFRRVLADHDIDPDHDIDQGHTGTGEATVVDVGAGDSWFGSQLAAEPGRATPVVCWDIAYTDDDLADPPAGAVRTRRAPDATFEVVLLMDVLEHVADPRSFLANEVRPMLAPGATILASVPAHQRLFGPHDTSLGHHRRYAPSEFLDEIGILAPVVADGPLFVTLTVPRALRVALARARVDRAEPAGIGNWNHGTVVTALVSAWLGADAALCRVLSRYHVPIPGLSHWAVAKVPISREHADG